MNYLAFKTILEYMYIIHYLHYLYKIDKLKQFLNSIMTKILR